MSLNIEVTENQKFWKFLDYLYSDAENETKHFAIENCYTCRKTSNEILNKENRPVLTEEKMNTGKIHYYLHILNFSD